MGPKVSPLHAGDGSLDPLVSARATTKIRENYRRVTNRAYPAMLRGKVLNCVDVMVVNCALEVLMGWRVNEPWKDHWHPSGGEQVPGDSYGETGALHLKRDLGLIVEPNLFEFVSSASFPWSTSAQGVPCHMNGILMVVLLTDEELATRNIPEGRDFATSRLFPLTHVTEANSFHPAIALGARMILFNQSRFARLGTIDFNLL